MPKMDLNRNPYHDDFSAEKNFMKILYRPGRPVQARELNQAQSISQSQIEKFANHVFKNGSKVSNAHTSLQAKSYIRLLGTPNVAIFAEGMSLVGEASGVTAKLVYAINAENNDPATIYVVYTGTAIDGSTSTFIPGENIHFLDENGVQVSTVTVRCPSCPGSGLNDTIPPVGSGQMFTITEGIIYFEGMFINVPRQNIVVSKYLEFDANSNLINFEPCKIGLDFVQTIVTYEDDPSLLDPSLGYPNSTAPGADRYKVDLILVKRPLNAEDGENFIALCRLGEGMRIEFMKADSEYSNIMDTIAKRTHETNGDYTIRPFRVSFLNSKKTSSIDPLGWSLGGNEDQLVAVVTPSVAYVKGYRVESISDTPAAFDKARDTKKMGSFVKHFDGRTYILGQPKGSAIWPHPHDDPSTLSSGSVMIYNGVTNGSSAGGAQIGTFKVSDAEYVSGDLGAGTAIYKYYIYDLTLTPGARLSNAKSFAAPALQFFTAAVEDSSTGQVEIYNANQTALIYRLDRSHVKSLRSNDDANNGSMNVVVRKKFTGVADGSGNLTFTTSSNEYFDNASGSLVGWSTLSGTTTKFHAPAVSTLTPTSLSLELGSGSAGATVYIIADILRTNQTEKQKTPTNLTVLTDSSPQAAIGSEVPLGVVDAFRIRSVKVFEEGSPGTEIADITNEYRIHSGITDLAYTESKIIRTTTPAFTFAANHRLAINFDYLAHSGGQGYFTIDSYSAALNDPDSGLTYENLGSHTSEAGTEYPIASSIDFRPIIMSGSPIVSMLPANNSTAIFDIEYYLGRADLLQINKDGVIYVKKGEPSETPRIPRPDSNAMALYEIWLTPYTYNLKGVSTRYIDNRRYTMRDIGSIDKRLTNVEYFTALSVLEKSAADMSIKDENGFDRYKNGFIADNFQDFQAADLTHVEFKAAVDRSARQLRPQFKASNRKLVLNTAKSSGYQLRGNVAVRPFTEEVAVEQPYATKSVSVNPYLQYNQRGQLSMSPNNDVWVDETRSPEVIIDIDAGVDDFVTLVPETVPAVPSPGPIPVVPDPVLPEVAPAAPPALTTDWGSWIDQNQTILTPPVTVTTPKGGGFERRPDMRELF